MKKLVLLIPLAVSTLFCSLDNITPSQDVPVTVSATAQTESVSPSLTPVTAAVPSLVWLPFEHASESHDNKILTVRNGKGAFEPAPVDVGVFWDYTALTGRLAYASVTKIGHAGTRSGESAVSDLWVYDYQTGQAGMWLPNDVVDARWSPVTDPLTSKQYLAAVLYKTTLVLLSGPNETTVLSENASPSFSWSPDGHSIAYMNDAGLFIVSVADGKTRQVPNVVPGFGGWVGDKPIWAPEQQALIYAKAPVEIASLDGSSVFTPQTPDGKSPVAERASNILWSPEKHILAFDVGESDPPVVWIYTLSPDLKTIVSSYSFERIEIDPLAAWWSPGESILLRTGEIWSISEKRVIDGIH